MKLIIIHTNQDLSITNGDSLLRFAVSSEPLAGALLDGLSRRASRIHRSVSSTGRFAGRRDRRTVCAVPEGWGVKPRTSQVADIVSYAGKVPVCPELLRKAKGDTWLVVSNGRFPTQINQGLLRAILVGAKADVVAVNAESRLLAAHEIIRLTVQGRVAGFRRVYDDSAELASISTDWPHHLFLRTNIIERLLDDSALPGSFTAVLERSRSSGLTLRGINVAGSVLDLETEEGLLGFCRAGVFLPSSGSYARTADGGNGPDADHNDTAQREPRFIGKILFGENVHIEQNVIIAGPSIIGDNVRIERGAVIESSIIGPKVCVPQRQLVRNCVLTEPHYRMKGPAASGNCPSRRIHSSKSRIEKPGFTSDVFRNWGMFSYARCLKRIIDFLFAALMLALFVPIMPFIALAIKLTSPGPVFYKDKRQGRYGRQFNCLKFRTMRTGSNTIQEKLRVVSQVDGPQFKIHNDPRITTVGKFLRDTYIDEIPQFLNVLMGQMSVVGPRPSPEFENTLCPSWRDARLSVRPGITGLWQVRRTRKPEMDFQEWIHFDTEYVRDLSFGMDLRICARTVMKMVGSFINQFGKINPLIDVKGQTNGEEIL
ncbi:MAG: sugar transferase [Phycisphaerae bacterium]|nr:sugar transferase [Phycisphaerae bacterium]